MLESLSSNEPNHEGLQVVATETREVNGYVLVFSQTGDGKFHMNIYSKNANGELTPMFNLSDLGMSFLLKKDELDSTDRLFSIKEVADYYQEDFFRLLSLRDFDTLP